MDLLFRFSGPCIPDGYQLTAGDRLLSAPNNWELYGGFSNRDGCGVRWQLLDLVQFANVPAVAGQAYSINRM